MLNIKSKKVFCYKLIFLFVMLIFFSFLSLVYNETICYGDDNYNFCFPEKFDLRNCDLDGTGEYKSYVTSVKNQGGGGTCGAFAGTSASETSILSELRQNSGFVDSAGIKHDSIDLSEHFLAGFNFSPMTFSENSTQAGEGTYCGLEEKEHANGNQGGLSNRIGGGAVALSTISTYTNGFGPVIESYKNGENLIQNNQQFFYKGANSNIENVRGLHWYSNNDDGSIDQSLRYSQHFELEEANILPDVSKTKETGTYDLEHAMYVTNLMKEQLMDGKALDIGYACDTYNPNFPSYSKPIYLNPATGAQYTWEPVKTTHAVTIVGGDDTYSKSNFLPGHQPPGDGAGIVKNSGGSIDSGGQGLNNYYWGIDNTGYFYLSYYDQSITEEVSYNFDCNLKEMNDHSKINNQYDYIHPETPQYKNVDHSTTTANVFTATEDQKLVELSTITGTEDVNVTFQVYKLQNADQDIDKGKLLCTVNKDFRFKGYHRIKLDKTLDIREGEIFAVAVTQKTEYGYLIGLNYDFNKVGHDAGMLTSIDDYYCLGVVNPGESFIYYSEEDQGKDFSTLKKEGESTAEGQYLSYDNFPIKAYSIPTTLPSIEEVNFYNMVVVIVVVVLLSIIIAITIILIRYLVKRKQQ